MKTVKYILISMLFFFVANTAQANREMYISNTSEILGNNIKENDLLLYAISHKIETLQLSGIGNISKQSDLLSKFISKARTLFNIKNISVLGSSSKFFESISQYNSSIQDDSQKINIYTFKYWDNKQENTAPFDTYLNSLKEIKKLINKDISLQVEILTAKESQIKKIVGIADVISLYTKASTAEMAIKNIKKEVASISIINNKFPINIIFSLNKENMYNYFRTNDMLKTEDTLKQYFNKKAFINSFSYSNYNNMSLVNLDNSDQ